MPEAEVLIHSFSTMAEDIGENLGELSQLVDRAALEHAQAPADEGHSLRTVDNAYRHGFKVLFQDAVPSTRQFHFVAHETTDATGEFAVDLFQSMKEPKFATIDARPERTEAHLYMVETMAIRMKQLTRAFMARLLDDPALLFTTQTIDLQAPDPSLSDIPTTDLAS